MKRILIPAAALLAVALLSLTWVGGTTGANGELDGISLAFPNSLVITNISFQAFTLDAGAFAFKASNGARVHGI